MKGYFTSLMGQSICKGCGARVDTTLMKIFSGQKFCPKCAPAREKEVQTHKEINAIFVKMAHGNVDYLPRFNRELEQLTLRNEWKMSGVLATLHYIYSMEEPPEFNPNTGITWLIERYYPIARKYYLELQALKNRYHGDDINNIVHKPIKEVQVNRSDFVNLDEGFIELQRTVNFGPELDLDELILDLPSDLEAIHQDVDLATDIQCDITSVQEIDVNDILRECTEARHSEKNKEENGASIKGINLDDITDDLPGDVVKIFNDSIMEDETIEETKKVKEEIKETLNKEVKEEIKENSREEVKVEVKPVLTHTYHEFEFGEPF